MKSKFIIIILAFSVCNIFAQTDSLKLASDIYNLNRSVLNLENKIDTIQIENAKILQENKFIKKSQSVLTRNYRQTNTDFDTYKKLTARQIDSLKQIIDLNASNIKTRSSELDGKIEETHKSANQSINDLNKTVNQNTLYWIIAILLVAVLVLLVFILLRKQIFKQRTDLNSTIEGTRKILENESLKLDNKLIEILETQLKIIKSSSTGVEKNTDHKLALKVADEIIRIQKNLTRMDEKTKGLKQLTASVKRIQDNFASNGYELVEMLGEIYNEGMRASANFIPDEDLESGQQIITRIIKPQVNYKGVMIQSAQIEVSIGE